MNSGSKVLLLTDFSEVSYFAASYALQILRGIKGRVEVLHVLQTPVDWIKVSKDREHLFPEIIQEIAHAKAKLADLVAEFEKAGIQAVSSLLFSFGPENVFSHVQNSNADLVVMGSQGKSASRGFMLGSNAQKILRNIKTPTLVVKKSGEKSRIEKIAFLSTLDQGQAEVLSKLKMFSELMESDIELVYVNTPYNFIETKDSDRKFSSVEKEYPSIKHVLINAYSVERGVLMYAEKFRPDLFVIAKSEKPDLVKFFSPSLTEYLVREHDFPILSIAD